MFPRLIIAFIVVVAALAFVRHVRMRMAARSTRVLEAKTARCPVCRVYFPRAEAVVRGSREYCSSEHADEGAA
jgi:hypothetical protein